MDEKMRTIERSRYSTVLFMGETLRKPRGGFFDHQKHVPVERRGRVPVPEQAASGSPDEGCVGRVVLRNLGGDDLIVNMHLDPGCMVPSPPSGGDVPIGCK